MTGREKVCEDRDVTGKGVIEEFGCFRKRHTEKGHQLSRIKAQGTYTCRRDPAFQKAIRKRGKDLTISKEKSGSSVPTPIMGGKSQVQGFALNWRS